jgi:penicillin-binding protein 1A
MASRRPKSSAFRRRSAAGRKRSSRTRARRRNSSRSAPSAASGKTAARKRSPLFLLCFWPFMLTNRITRSWPAVLRVATRAAAYPALAVLGLLFVVSTVYVVRSLRYDVAQVGEMPERSIIFDRNRNELGRLHGEHREIVDLEHVSPNFINPLLAREDRRFRSHFGVDPRGVARAIVQNVKRKHFAQGASTLTMQLARNAFGLSQDGPKWRQFDRKLLEVALAFRLEARFSKDEILEHYVNLIFWGGSIHGVEAASRADLEKPGPSATPLSTRWSATK